MSRFRLPDLGTPRAPVAMGMGTAGDVDLAGFYGLCGAVAEAVGAGGPGDVLVACADRLHLAAAVVGSWLAGRAVILTSPQSPARAAELRAASGAGVAIGDEAGPGVIGVPALSPRLPAGPLELDGARLCARLYTGGSTGAPVAHAKTFDQLLGEATLLAGLLDLAGARVLPTVPAHHIYGLLVGVLAPLVGGGTFARETPTNPARIAAAASALRADLLVAVPPHLKALADSSEGRGGLRRAISSGGPLPSAVAALLRARMGIAVTELFGSTETGGIAHRQGDLSEVWTVFPGLHVRAAEDGTLLLRSPLAGAGEVASADRIELVAPDRFRHLGRRDDVVKVGGGRVGLRDLEHRLSTLPGVQEVAVFARPVPPPRDAEICCAIVAPAVPLDDLRRELRRWFDPVVLPRRWRVLTALPRAATGKLQAEAVRALFDPAGGAIPDGEQGPLVTFETRTHSQTRTDETERHIFEVFVPADAWYFRGHFPGDPILPGIAQLNDLVMPHLRRVWPGSGRPRGLTRVKFRSPIRPRDLVEVELERSAASSVRFALRVRAEEMAGGIIELEGGA